MSSFSSDLEIGERLQSLRNQKGLSQRAMSEALGISMRTYQNYERGERSITKEFICSFCEQFNVSSDWLLSGHSLAEEALDWSRLETIISAIETILEKESLKLESQKKVKLISLFYKLSSETGELSQDTVHDMLMLSMG